MIDIEDKILEAIKELTKWESRKERVNARVLKGDADKSEIDRINEQIEHYKALLQDMKKEISATDLSRTIARSGSQ
tara:strand:- start:75 stop:302 length:228 start_codon:yes stop_codon:yes gene_type:complete